MSPPKCCAVCGDKALGYNFNAVTCESCKAFFRRNALAKKQFTCPFNQNCDITVVTRRFCQKCRLKKCLDIGMRSENIMSDEDKQIKRRKIETNRARRRINEQKLSNVEKRELQVADSSGYDAYAASYDSCGSVDSATGGGTSSGQPTSSTTTNHTKVLLGEPVRDVNPELMTGEEMVEFIVSDPDRASQAISKLMRTPAEAIDSLEKIINSQKDALRLISHLIAYPGDALKIISKVMNSPFNALTVFTQFMSSPTDALEIISKVVSSPQDVLQFIKNLMDSPEEGLDIMNKFMNTPAEALKIINKLFNGSNPPTLSVDNSNNELLQLAQTQLTNGSNAFLPEQQMSPLTQIQSPKDTENTLIHSMLNGSSPASVVLLSPPSVTPPNTADIYPPPSLTPQSMASSYTASPQAMPLISAHSPLMDDSSLQQQQYHSPASLNSHDELPSTSTMLISNSPTTTTNITTDADFDIKSFIQTTFPGNSNAGDSLNSLESVLSEVIRIEFQAFNKLGPESTRVKHEHALHMIPHESQSYGTCNLQQQPICAPSSVIMSRDLNEAEQLKLNELKLASDALYLPVDDDLSVLMGDDRIKAEDTHQDPKLLQVVNLTAVAIKRLIKMAKKISVFRDMCQEDQVALLKGGCTEMMIMRSVMTYDDCRRTWKIPHTKEDMSNIRAEVLKLAKGNVYEEHLKFIRTFDEKWRKDENIILIMCAIVLFTPTRPRIIHTDVIRLEQNSYYYLLRRYLESVYAGCEAKSAFIKLIQKISDVERLNQFIIGVYLNVNPSQVEPLLREIFDLKNH